MISCDMTKESHGDQRNLTSPLLVIIRSIHAVSTLPLDSKDRWDSSGISGCAAQCFRYGPHDCQNDALLKTF